MENVKGQDKRWKDEEEYDFVISNYLLEKIGEIPNILTMVNIGRLEAFNMEKYREAQGKNQAAKYLTEWIKRNRLQIDIPRLTKEAELNFTALLGAYKIDLKESNRRK